MIEIIIKEHLGALLPVPVLLERPVTDAERFVLIEKVGSGIRERLDSSTFAFQSYAGSLYEVAGLNLLVKAAVDRLIERPEIARVQLNSDYNFTDVTTKQYRYQAVYDINHY